ncbi:MAG: polymerase sigma factor, sigma-70 family, partial [Verrucomicrobiales bacterium]|nr:polymerase sigma factor, sigma-70 family [Verrucomicrobiales bacterium]
DFKNPQELYAEIQRILPEWWTANLRAHDRNGDNLWNLKETPLFRIDLKNPNFSGFGGQYNLQLYFLTNSAENKVFLNLSPDYRYGAIRLFSTSAHYIVFLSRDLINDFPYGLRSVAPVGRALQRYFGSPKDPEIASWIGLEDRPSGVLLGKSGFQGIVLDDETGEPIPRFSLEFNPKPNRVNGPSQAWSMSSQFYGGRFALEGEGYPELERVIRIDEVRELPLWRKGTTVNGWVIAKGYNPEGLTDTSVVWPARLTNIVVRLKRTTVPNDPEVSTSIPKTVDQIFYELQKVLPEGWTCNLVQTTTVPGSESTTEKGSLVRGIYFKNPDISFGGELNLQLYFLTTPEEKRRFFGHWSGKPYGPLLFTDTPDFQVVLFMDVIKGVSTLYPVRSVEPVARILKRYFGPPIDTSLNDSLGLHGIAAGELTGYSGFSGQVLDDETGRPVKKFHLKFVPKARALEDSDLVYFDGRFTLEGNGISGFVVDRKFEWNGYPNWASYNGVQGFVFADGYVSTPLLPEPVPWPAKVTNIVIRLKKKGFPGKMEAPIDETQTAKNEAKSKSSPEPRSILSPIQGRLINETTGETIPQFWLQHGVVTRTGATNWSEYYEARATDWSSTFSIARQSAAQVWRILAISHEPYVVTSQEFDANWGNYVVRLKPGQKLRGRVLNDKGQPVEGTFISVTNVETRLDLVTGLANALGCNSTTTDAQGKFVLPRPSGTKMKIVAISPDRQMIQPASISEDGRDVQITFPQPATLSMNYDIPGDTALPSMGMALVTFEKDPALWKGIEFVVTSPLTNGAKTILSNLTPGRYSFLRGHRTQMPNNSQGVGMGLDAEVLNLEAGKMGAKDIIRTNGFRIRGIVSGLEKAGAEKGRLRVGGGSWGNTTVDALYFGRDGSFQTVMLPPGKYRVEAVALAQAVEPTKSESSGLRETPMSFSAGMVVTLTGTEPEVVKLDLLLSSDPANEKKREEIRREMSSTNGTR